MSFLSEWCVTERKKTDVYYRNSNMDEGNFEELTAEITQLKKENKQLKTENKQLKHDKEVVQQDKEVLQSNCNTLLQKNNEYEILITGYKQQIHSLDQQQNAMTIHLTSTNNDEEKMMMTSENTMTLQHHETELTDARLVELQMKTLGTHAKDNPHALLDTIVNVYSINKDGDGVDDLATDGDGGVSGLDDDADSDSSNMSDEELERIQNEKIKMSRRASKRNSKIMTKEDIDTFDPTFNGIKDTKNKIPPPQTKKGHKKQNSNLFRDQSITKWEADEIEQRKDEMAKQLTSLMHISINKDSTVPMSMDNV